MRGAILLPALAIAQCACGPAFAAKPYPGTIDGATLLRFYMGPSTSSESPYVRSGEIVDRELARGYLDGIKDATEGSVWCYVTGKPHELSLDVTGVLAKMSPDELKGPAAPLVLKALRQLYPCPAGTGGRP